MATEQESTSIPEQVRQGYEVIAEKYLEFVRKRENPGVRYLNRVLERVPSSATFLEIGCGAGVPVLERLIEHAHPESGSAGKGRVIGNDISDKQLELARGHCPGAELVRSDMASLAFEEASLSVVASFFAIIHLPREQQETLFANIYRWLQPGGFLVCNLSTEDMPEARQNFLGAANMFWSGFEVEQNKKMLSKVGFRLEEAEVCAEEDLKSDDPDKGVTFLWIIAQKP